MTLEADVTAVKVLGAAKVYLGGCVTAESLTMTGSGCISIETPQEFFDMEATVTGSGHIDLGRCSMGNLRASVTGSGIIDRFYVRRHAVVNMVGSGIVKGHSKDDAVTTCDVVGSGQVRL